MKNYQYKLTYDHITNPVPNSGGSRTTDWINPVLGLAEGWEKLKDISATQIITGAGWVGNAQRFIKAATAKQGLRSDINIQCIAGRKVVLKIRYASNIEWGVYINNTLVETLPDNSLTPTNYEIEFIPTESTISSIEISEEGSAALSEFIIDVVEFQLIPAVEQTLTKNPIGWNNLGISFVRNDVYHSVLRSFALSLRFPKKPGAGGTNIEMSYLIDGISAKVDIEISERNPQTNGYDAIYTGIIDFNPKRFKNERDWIEAGIIDSGKLQDFKSRDEINFDLNSILSADDVSITPFVSSPKDIIFKPIDIYLNVSEQGIFRTPIGFMIDVGDYIESNYFAGNSLELGTGITVNEIGDRLNTEEGDVIYYTPPPPGVSFWMAENTTPEIYTNDNEYPVQIVFKDVDVLENNSYVIMTDSGHLEIAAIVELRVYDVDDILTFTYFPFVEGIARDNPSSETYNIIFDLDALKVAVINVPAGGKMTLVTTIRIIQEANCIVLPKIDYEPNLDFTEISLSIGETSVKSYFPFEAFTRLIQLMTSETDTAKLFESEYLGRTDSEFVTYGVNGGGSLDAITTGWNLRGFPDNAFNVSLKDLFKTFDEVHGLGLGYDRVNDLFYIETIDNFYKAGYLMFDLGEVAGLVRNPYDMAFESKINSGYVEKGDYEDFQGVNEFNLQSEHSLSLPVKKTKAARALYSYASITIELTRRFQYAQYASRDTKHDEKICIALTDGNYTIQGGADLSGFDGIDEYYNLKYTPRENLIRNAGYYKSALWNHELRIKFIKAAKDKNITYTNQNGDTVNEFDDLETQDLQKPALYVPEQYEFEGILTPAILTILNDDPHGYIRFTFDGNTYEGYLLTIESGYYNRKANYKLIAKQLTFGDNYVFEDKDNYVFEEGDNYVF